MNLGFPSSVDFSISKKVFGTFGKYVDSLHWGTFLRMLWVPFTGRVVDLRPVRPRMMSLSNS